MSRHLQFRQRWGHESSHADSGPRRKKYDLANQSQKILRSFTPKSFKSPLPMSQNVGEDKTKELLGPSIAREVGIMEPSKVVDRRQHQ